MSEKLTAKEYAEKLLYTPEYAADKQADVKEKAAAFAEGYKKFMDSAKTEREAAVVSEQMLLAAGYKAFEPKKAYAPGEKVYFIQENKAVVAATIGQKPYEEGFRLVIAHIDCPRLDLRPNPLYESDHMSYFRTHYYGGVRKLSTACSPAPTAPASILPSVRTRTIPCSASPTCCPIWVPSRTSASSARASRARS